MTIKEADLHRLTCHCEWQPDSFSLVFFYGNEADRQQALQSLSQANIRPEIVSVTLAPPLPNVFNSLIDRLTPNQITNGPQEPLWIDFTSPDIEVGLSDFFSRLNERRFSLEKNMRPLIFQLPTSLQPTHTLDYIAPDLFHIRSLQISA